MTNVSSKKRMISLPLIAMMAAGALLAGCSSTGTPEESSVQSDQTDAEAPSETVESGAEIATAVDGPECLIGNWTADPAFFASQFAETGADQVEIGGDVVISFGADGTMSTDYQDMSVTFASADESTTIVRKGTDSGTYTLTGSKITIEDDSIQSELTLSMLGTENVMPGAGYDVVDWDYTCVGDQATLTGPDSAILLVRRG